MYAILTVRSDVTVEKEIPRSINDTIENVGRIDGVFLCAGISYSSTSTLGTDVGQYDKAMQVNCRSGTSNDREYMPIL